MSDFKFSCPHCEQHLQCEARLGGRQIQCPACNHLIVIPLTSTQQEQGHAPESGKTWNTHLPQSPQATPPASPAA